MNILKVIISFLLTILPIAILIRDWKFHDKRTKKHHNITRTIFVFWCIGSIVATIFVWIDSAQIKELIDGKDTVIAQNKKLSKKLDKYQKDIDEKEQKIKELEKQAQNAEKGITLNYWANGCIRDQHGGVVKLNCELKNIFENFISLQNIKNFNELKKQCMEQIKKIPKWPTPYLYLGVSFSNLGNREKAIKNIEHFLEATEGIPSNYGYSPFRTQAESFIEQLKK